MNIKQSGFCIIFSMLSSIFGFHFRGTVHKLFCKESSLYNVENPFDTHDINSLDERVKRTEIISHSQGNILKMQAMNSKNTKYATNLFNEALKYFRQSLQAVPRNQRTLRNVGDVFQHTKKYRLARLFYLTALDTSKSDPISIYKYAYFLHKVLGEPDDAESYYIKSHEIHPTLGNMLSYASFLTERGTFEKALKLYKEASELFKDNPIALFSYAKFLHTVQKKNLDIAGELYAKAYEMSPQNPDILKYYAEYISNINGDGKKAEELLKQHKRSLKLSNNDVRVSFRFRDV